METSGIPQELVLEPVSFNIFVCDMDSGIECTFSNTKDTKLSRAADVLERRNAIQRDPDRLEK